VNHQLGSIGKTNLTGGVQATVNVSPGQLKTLYGSTPIGGEVYIRISPSLMMGHNQHQHKMEGMNM